MAGRTLRNLVLPTLILMLALIPEEGRAAVPSGFSDTLVTDVSSPTAIAFTPDGRLLITQKAGRLQIWNGSLLSLALTIPDDAICTASEQGLLGVAVDPDFASNRRIYLFYTFEKPTGGCVNRVSRFAFFSAQPNQIDPASELVLIDNMPSPAGNHNAGDLHFGKDGYLYVSIGDGGCDYANDSGCAGQNDAARDQHVLTGKILRITRDGGIPPTNPFQGANTARCNVTGGTTLGNKCQETFAWGLRNPFRFAMDPNAVGTRFFINDVGQGAWEEIDNGQAGADYGWNCREGAHTNSTSGKCSPAPPNMVDPIFEYPHGTTLPGTTSTNCHSITGGAFVPNGLWPGYDNAYLFGDFVCGGIFKLSPSGQTWTASDFASGVGGAVHMIFGPWGDGQALYYTTFGGGGQVRRISPPLVGLTFQTQPAGLDLIVNGSVRTTPFTWSAPAGSVLTVDAPAQEETAGLYVFAAWSDSIAAAPRRLTVPTTPATITALFELSETGGPADLYTVTPCRVVDTRGPAGPVGGPALAAGQTRTFPIAGSCGIPTTAEAVAINVTVVTPSSGGHLRVWPADDAGTGTAAISFAAGVTRSNHLVLPLEASGDLSVLNAIPNGTAHLVIDVMGYFE